MLHPNLLIIGILALSNFKLNSTANAQAAVQLREAQLAAFVTEVMPRFQLTQLEEEAARLQNQLYSDQFVPLLRSQSTIIESDDPRASSQIQAQSFSFQQRLEGGIGVFGGLQLERQKLAPQPFLPPPFAGQRLYTPVLSVGLEFDLWQNFMGRFDRSQRQHLSAIAQRSNLKAELDRKAIHLTLRKMYWQLASQNRRIAIYQQLLQTAERGYQDAVARRRDHIADQGMVAKLLANRSSAQAQYEAAKMQKLLIERELKVLIPSLQGRRIEIVGTYEHIRQAVRQSVRCAETVSQLRSIPFDHTQYDELIYSIQQALEAEQSTIRYHDRSDIKLRASAQSFGMDESFSEAQKQAGSLDKTAYEVTLSIDVPLGRQLSRSKEQRLSFAQRQARVDQMELEAQFKATHESLSNVIQHLAVTVDLFHKSITQLEDAFKDAGIKFRQGRIAVHEYIADQDALLATQLQVLGIEERIIIETLSYFRIFNQSPCEFNRI